MLKADNLTTTLCRCHEILEPQLAETLWATPLLAYSVVQSPSWEANWFVASQEIPCISRNPKVHYRTVSILSHPNPVHILTSHLLEIHSNIIHPSAPLCRCHVIWEPQLRGTLWATPGLQLHCFTLFNRNKTVPTDTVFHTIRFLATKLSKSWTIKYNSTSE